MWLFWIWTTVLLWFNYAATEKASFTQFSVKPSNELDAYLKPGVKYRIKGNPVSRCTLIEIIPLSRAGEENREGTIGFDRENHMAFMRATDNVVYNWYVNDIVLEPLDLYKWSISAFGGADIGNFGTSSEVTRFLNGERMARNDLNQDGHFDNQDITPKRCGDRGPIVDLAKNLTLVSRGVGQQFVTPNVRIKGNSPLCQLWPIEEGEPEKLDMFWHGEETPSCPYGNGYVCDLPPNEVPTSSSANDFFTLESSEGKKGCCFGFKEPLGNPKLPEQPTRIEGLQTVISKYIIKCGGCEDAEWMANYLAVEVEKEVVMQNVRLASFLLEIHDPSQCDDIQLLFAKDGSRDPSKLEGNTIQIRPVYGVYIPPNEYGSRVINAPLEKRNLFRFNIFAHNGTSIEYDFNKLGVSASRDYVSLRHTVFKSPDELFVYLRTDRQCLARLVEDKLGSKFFKEKVKAELKQRISFVSCTCGV